MNVLVIDDEPAIRQVIAAIVKRAGYTVDVASNATEAAARLVRGGIDLALCDIHMPDGNGLDLVRSIKESGVDTEFIMVTAFASVETAVQALKAGAADYVIKPVNNSELIHRLEQIAAMRGLRDENRALRKLVAGGGGAVFRFDSGAMQGVDRLISKVAVTDSTVLVTGESGTGKGVVARLLHERSNRAKFPFVPVNCGAIPETLLESELFGHTKGSFTGADRNRKGLFMQADQGTLFLDEIGELPLHMQAKLLHAIEDKAVRPVGSEEVRRADARIIVATNRNLLEMVSEGKFREDLYFRLSMFHIPIPPLRERAADIRGLIEFFLDGLAKESGRRIRLDPGAEEIMISYAWPGNVRQLQNAINRASILADSDTIGIADLPGEITKLRTVEVGATLGPVSDLREMVRKYEASVIGKVLEEVRGDRKLAALRLGIGVSSLYRKIDEYQSQRLLESGM